jgi:serine/threonine protein kinase
MAYTQGPCAANAVSRAVMGSTFTLDSRYVVSEVLGSGAYGIVVAAVDSKTGERVAIKKIEKAFEHATFTKRSLRELKVMRLLVHENILGIKSIQLPRSRDDFSDIYVVVELMETDLSSIIKSPQPLSDDHCKFFLYQLLRGLKFMHSAGILHRDLKPRNLLVNSNCDLKICDFGLARANLPGMSVRGVSMTDYVATRWYRAPEVLLTYRHYTEAMDVWSVGVILGELFIRRPLLPGNDANHQCELIFNLIGTPSEQDLMNIPNPRSRDKALRFAPRMGKPFECVFHNCNPLGIDLLKRLLVFDPQQRITVEEALNHPYLADLHFPADEPVMSLVSLFDFEFENYVMTISDLKDLLYSEILLHHFPQRLTEYTQQKLQYDIDLKYCANDLRAEGQELA